MPLPTTVNDSTQPKIFISYSWDHENHKDWVLLLADRLVKDGIDVILDRYDMHAGKNLFHFVEDAIAQADKIIMIFTPAYKKKAELRKDIGGYEYSIINVGIFKNIALEERIIPVLRESTVDESIPKFIQQFIHIDFSNDHEFEEKYNELIRIIYNIPWICKGTLGIPPDLDQRLPIGNNRPIPSAPKRNSKKRRTLIVTFSISFGITLPLTLLFIKSNNHTFQYPESRSIASSDPPPTQPVKNSNATQKEPPIHIISRNNNEKYDFVDDPIEGIQLVRLNGKFGFMNKSGNDINGSATVELKYDFAERFSEGMAKVKRNSYYGFINTKGELVIGMIYEYAESFIGGKAKVRKGVNWFYVDRNNKCVEGCTDSLLNAGYF